MLDNLKEARAWDLLRLHVEAVWGVSVPALTGGHSEVVADGDALPWALYLAIVEGEQVRLWRPGLSHAEQPPLLRRAELALAGSGDAGQDTGVTQEVALARQAAGRLTTEEAARVARSLSADDLALLEEFDPGESRYYLRLASQPVVGVVTNGRLVSVAHSARRTVQCCELGVETVPSARGQGYGLAVTLLWTSMVALEGLVPLYSALAQNTASLALAAAAGYRPFARATYVLPAE